jgi:hypothetical protein
VLKGEMSIVGPRPCLPYEAELYQQWQLERFNAAPGLTGLWQVSGKNRTTFTQMIQLDIQYARTKSLWLDLKIIFKTVPALLVQMWESKFRKKNSANNDVSPAPVANDSASVPVIAGKKIELTSKLVEGAFEALMAGDGATHNAKVAAALKELSQSVDVIVLAQASMARVVDSLTPTDKRVPILASPGIAVDYLATVL